MKKLLLSLAVVAVAAASCQKDVVYNDIQKENESVELTATRSYDEALKIAESALSLLEGEDTRSAKKRVIKRMEGQTVLRPVTRGSETAEEPIMYVFNNENDEGFTVVAADRSRQPLIAVTEEGNYTYGEPTGVEPFDLLMEDVATTLALYPDEPLAIMQVHSDTLNYGHAPIINIQWGTEGIYGALFPDGKAYAETPAIAQTLMGVYTDESYTVTIPGHELYGQSVPFDKVSMRKHIRNNYHPIIVGVDTTAIHDMISLLYREIGQRLSEESNISLTRKNRSMSMSDIHTVLSSFGCHLSDIDNYTEESFTFRPNAPYHSYRDDILVIQGSLDNYEEMENGLYIHTWIATGIQDLRHDYITYGLNKFYNPTHPDPYGYTEISRVEMQDVLLYMNWGFDGIGNGWFYRGCFDMSERQYMNSALHSPSGEYDYNFSDISFFLAEEYPLVM